MKLLQRAPGVQLVQFLQGPLGKEYAKLTCILQGRLPLLATDIFASYAAGWRATKVLGGRDASGQWRTMEAKEYPPLLSQILARQFRWYDSECERSGDEQVPEGLAEAVELLGQTWDPYGSCTGRDRMLQDYQPLRDG